MHLIRTQRALAHYPQNSISPTRLNRLKYRLNFIWSVKVGVDVRVIRPPQKVVIHLDDLREFAEQWRTDITAGTMEKRKSIFRQIVDSATFDGTELQVIPSYQAITGVKVASPRGVEPLLPG